MQMSTVMKKGVQFSTKKDEIFFETQQVWTPQLDSSQEVAYKNPSERNVTAVAPPSTLSRPNYEDILRRVSMVIQQHIAKCEYRLSKSTPETDETGLFHTSKMQEFNENHYLQPQYVYHFVRAPVSRLGFLYGIKQHAHEPTAPDLNDIYTFLRGLFIKAQLSPECSIVCLIYVERLMEMAHVPLVARTWRPCLLCGLLLASKVWQDLRFIFT